MVGPEAAEGFQEEVQVTIGNKNTEDVYQIPRWLSHLLDNSDLTKVSESISKVERNSEGEIVPMVVRSSMNLGRLPQILTGFLFCLFGAVVSGILSQYLEGDESSYSGVNDILLNLSFILEVFGFLIGYYLGRYDFFKHIFISKTLLKQSVAQRAELEFYRARINNTTKHTGVLIFVSFEERSVFVLADRGISDKVDPNQWKDVAGSIVEGIKAKDLGGGLVKAIETCGKHLKDHFPTTIPHENEIANRLIFHE